MTNKKYNAGRAFEYKIKKHLEAQGYFVVRAAGSRGPVDLVAFQNDSWPLFIQCKLDGKISKADKTSLVELAKNNHAYPMLVSRFKPKYSRSYELRWDNLYEV